MKDFLKNVLATITGIIVLGIIMAIISVISMVGQMASSASTARYTGPTYIIINIFVNVKKFNPPLFVTNGG